MANEVYLPGNILSLSAAAADRLIAAGSGDAGLLYLYLLRTGGKYDAPTAARRLKWEEGRCDAAMSLLVSLGLAKAPDPREAPPAPQAPQPPEYSAEDITKELEDGKSPFPALVAEVQRRLGKPLSTADLRSLYTIYDFSGLPPEVILLAVSWSIEEYQRKYGAGRMPRMPQIQREAFRWKEQGVDTAEAAEAHLKKLTQLRDRSVRVLALMDIRDRLPVAREREYIAGWIDMGFPDEVIRLAYEKTVLQKQSLNWPYMNSILKSWYQKGFHTVEEVEAGEGRRGRTGSAARTGAGATVPQPTRQGEADRRAREDMERLRQLMDRDKKEGK